MNDDATRVLAQAVAVLLSLSPRKLQDLRNGRCRPSYGLKVPGWALEDLATAIDDEYPGLIEQSIRALAAEQEGTT